MQLRFFLSFSMSNLPCPLGTDHIRRIRVVQGVPFISRTHHHLDIRSKPSGGIRQQHMKIEEWGLKKGHRQSILPLPPFLPIEKARTDELGRTFQ